MDQDCEIKVVGYRLDLSRTPQFLEAQQISSTHARAVGNAIPRYAREDTMVVSSR